MSAARFFLQRGVPSSQRRALTLSLSGSGAQTGSPTHHPQLQQLHTGVRALSSSINPNNGGQGEQGGKTSSRFIFSRRTLLGGGLALGGVAAALGLLSEPESKKNSWLPIFSSSINPTSSTVSCNPNKSKVTVVAGDFRTALPSYSIEEIAKHKKAQDRIWVTYKDGVYDVTDFIAKHPGGEKLLLAAGAAIDPFWELYQVHQSNATLTMLEQYRIGNIDPESKKRIENRPVDKTDPYGREPLRHPALVVQTMKPFNAETPPQMLVENFLTPNSLFYVRNHLPVPHLDEKNYFFEVSGVGLKEPVRLTLNDLKTKFQQHTIKVSVQCAGNRRGGLDVVKEAKGTQWGVAAVSTAEWTGVKLCDVISYVQKTHGVGEEGKPNIEHVQFEGHDKDLANEPYACSITYERATSDKDDVLLAYEMNGTPIPLDHGFPLRVVVPGVIGARQVKWLSKVILSPEESTSIWQRKDYKTFCPSTTFESADYNTMPAIQAFPVQSAICSHVAGQVVDKDLGEITLKGYALSGNGQGIIRVDVSLDGGKTWHVAELNNGGQPLTRSWAWTLWSVTIDLPVDCPSEIVAVCKAVDASYNTQPDSPQGVWNIRGLNNNSWHRVHMTCKSL